MEPYIKVIPDQKHFPVEPFLEEMNSFSQQCTKNCLYCLTQGNENENPGLELKHHGSVLIPALRSLTTICVLDI